MYFFFQPFYRPMIWGCERWILSGYPRMESVVAHGLYKGYTLSQLLAQLGEQLIGSTLWHRYGTHFPLLIKFIEANQPLSIQVHPSDNFAQQHGAGPVGKTEMWYALTCDKDAYLLSGLKHPLTPQTYKAHVANHTFVNDLMRYHPQKGDCFFLPAGRVHAIGTGCRLLEIQQASNLTYRIYDYDRRDEHGHTRELHTQLAAECIDYTVLEDYQTHYIPVANSSVSLVSCSYFITHLYWVKGQIAIDWSQRDRFLVIVITAGAGVLNIDGEQLFVTLYDTLLLPATTRVVKASGLLTLLTITCP